MSGGGHTSTRASDRTGAPNFGCCYPESRLLSKVMHGLELCAPENTKQECGIIFRIEPRTKIEASSVCNTSPRIGQLSRTSMRHVLSLAAPVCKRQYRVEFAKGHQWMHL